MPPVSLSRVQLYDRVWAEPMLKVAENLGISDVGLKKVCRRHDIPTPPRGYWAKKNSGQDPPVMQLPDRDRDDSISIQSGESFGPSDAEQAARDAEPRMAVANQLRNPHRLVAETQECLSMATKDECGLLLSDATLPIVIVTSKSVSRRALLIADALLKALELRGFKVSSGPKIEIEGQTVGFQIEEVLEAVSEEPKEHDLSGNYQFGHSRRNRKRVPSGRLKLTIPESKQFWSRKFRDSWSDGKKRKLEERLNDIVYGLVDAAGCLRDHEIAEQNRLKAEKELARRAAEVAKQRAERRKLQAEEQKRLDVLLNQLSNWKKSQDLRELVDFVLARHAEKGNPTDESSEIGQWASWVRMHANRFDPLCESPPSILDERIPDEPQRRW